MSNTIQILLSAIPENTVNPEQELAVVTGEEFIYKGASEIALDLSRVTEEDSRVLNAVIDWGDGSPREYYKRSIIFEYTDSSIINEVESGLIGGSILGTYTHSFTPADTHIVDYTIQVLLTYENGDDVLIKQPLTLVQESYYDNIKEFNIASIAIQDDTVATMTNLQSKHTDWTWPAYLTQESDISSETVTHNPFDDFNCDVSLASVVVLKDETSTGPYIPGSTATYNVSVTNTADYNITGVTLTDTLSNIVYADSLTEDFSTGNGILPANSTTILSYSYTISPDDTGTIDNTATITSRSLLSPGISNTVSIDVNQPLQLTKVSNAGEFVSVGDYISYTVTATNPNASDVTNARLFDSLEGIDIVSGNTDLFTGTTIPAGGTKAVNYQYQLQSSDVNSGSLVNVARLSGDGYAFVEDSTTTTLTPLQDLQVVKSIVGGTLQVDSAVQYTVVATNPNPVPVTNAKITDSLSDITVVGGDVNLFTGTTIPSLSSISVTYEYTIPQSYIGETEIVNTVSLSGDGYATVTDTETGTLQELPVFKFTIDTTKQFEDPSAQVDYAVGGGTTKILDLPGMNPSEGVYFWDINDGTGQTGQDQFQLPLIASGVYDFYVYWGDGTSDKITQYDDANTLHTYTTPGVKEITIYGQIEGWQFNNGGDRLKYIDTLEWTALTITTNAAFFGCENYTGATGESVVGAPTITTTDGSKMFKQCINFNGKVDNWYTGSIQNMESLFEHCYHFNKPVDAWSTDNVTTMQQMFAWCTSFNQPLNSWNVENVQKTENMFLSCRTFNQPLNNWILKGLSGSMGSMFSSCYKFNRNLNSWSQWMSGATKMDGMFKRCFVFNGNVSDWDVSNVTTFNQMFACDVGPYGVFNNDISGWQPSSVTNLALMFWGQHNFNIDISSWAPYLNNITTTVGMFQDAESFNQNLDTWGPKLSSVTDINNMFSRAMSFNNGDVAGASNFPLTSWDTSEVTDMAGLFSFTESAFNQDVSTWDVRNVVKTSEMFRSAYNFNHNLDAWAPQVSGVTDMSRMFMSAWSFNNGDAAGASTSPMNSWDVSSVENMSEMFRNAFAFNQPIDSWDVSSVTNMSTMFDTASTFDQPLNNWNVSSVENMSNMFASTTVFNRSLNNWNVSNVTNMDRMFFFSDFNQNIGSWDVGNVTTMKNMFSVIDSTGTSKLSQANYENLLNGWAGLTPNLQSGVTLDVQQIRPSGAAGAYTTLTSTHGWTINDKSS